MKVDLNLAKDLDKQVVLLTIGRFASAVGSGFTMFYAPIFFVNVLGIQATHVGIGIGCAGVAGVVGRIMGGSCADSPRFGRKGTLLIASALLTLGATFFAISEGLWHFIVGNILNGLGIGFYWPAAEAFIADVTKPAKLNEAFALTRLGDYIGLGLGVLLGGLVIGHHGTYRLIFIVDAISFLILICFIWKGLKETMPPQGTTPRKSIVQNWMVALSDRHLLFYALMNLLFTNNILQISTTLPIYFVNFVPNHSATGFDAKIIANLFSVYIVLISIFIMPLARLTAAWSKSNVLMIACVLWCGTFALCAYLGTGIAEPLVAAISIIVLFAFANALYGPSASSLVVEIAPEDSKAIYLSVNSVCWGVASSFGPALGLAALDQGLSSGITFWWTLSISSAIAVLGLAALKALINKRRK